ncbi:MAG: diacylglycerol kinase family protein [Ferruginibacter sp.]
MQNSIAACIGILVNPLSGNGKGGTTGRWLSEQLSLRRLHHQVITFPWPGSLEAYSEIWLVGGDGTLNYFLNNYKDNLLPLVIFKGGTGNDFAWKLYGDCSLQDHFNIALASSPQRVDVALCNGQYFANSSGIGFDGEVLKSITSIRKLGGGIGYLLFVLKTLLSYREPLFTITTKGKSFSHRYLLVLANNSSRTGGKFMVTPQASVNDGKIDLLLCKPLSVLKRLRFLPMIEKGKHLNLPFINYEQVENVLVTTDHEIYAQLDGELIKGNSFYFEVKPGRLLIKY